jgi:hypothetical protein
MYVCVGMYVRMYVCLYYVCMYVCIYVCMYACTYVCVCVCVWTYYLEKDCPTAALRRVLNELRVPCGEAKLAIPDLKHGCTTRGSQVACDRLCFIMRPVPTIEITQ